MKIFLRCLAAVLCLLLQINQLRSQWIEANGAKGDLVRCFALNGSALIAGTTDGCYRSYDNGMSWTEASSGLTNTMVNALAVSGMDVFAGTDSGVFLSMDNGANWIRSSAGLTKLRVLSFAVSGTNLFAGTENGGVFLSTNHGASWNAVNSGLGALDNSWVSAIAVSGSDLYVQKSSQWVNEDGVYHSTDNGATWIKTPLESYGGRALVVLGTDVYAEAYNTVYRSTDKGATWIGVGFGLPNDGLVQLAASGGDLFMATQHGGVYRSVDKGANWIPVNAGLMNKEINTIAVCGTDLFAGTNGDGAYRSSDNGSQWDPSNVGLVGISRRMVYAVAAAGANLFAGTYSSGVFVSTDQGRSWKPVNTGLTNTTVRTLVSSGEKLFAGTWGGIFYTPNNGVTWTPASEGLTNLYVNVLLGSGTDLLAATRGGIFRSSDNGAHWIPVLTNANVEALAISGRTLVAGTYNGGVFRSVDNGATWIEMNAGLGSKYIRSLAVSGSNIFVATSDGFYRCSTSDAQWNLIFPAWKHGINSILAADSILYACGSGGVIRSSDNGSTWDNLGLNESYIFNTLCISGTDLFTGIDGGVMKLSIPKAVPVPSAPVMIAPADGANEIPVDPSFTWSAPEGASSYRFQLSADSNFYSSSVDQSGITSTSFIVTGLSKNTTYYWRVNAANALGTSSWSSVRKFATIVNVPLPPTLISPFNGIHGTSTNPSLTWSAPPGAVAYRIQFAADSNFTAPIVDKNGITQTSYAVDSLARHTTYYWRVRAIGKTDTGAWSKTGNFSTKLDDPTFVAPANRATGIPLSTTLQWNPVPGRGWYSLQVSADSTFSSKLVDEYFIQTTSYTVNNLAYNTRYYWRLCVSTAMEFDPWTPAQSFTTKRSATDNVAPADALPKEFALSDNYPNPFNPSTTFMISIPSRSFVELKVYDSYGREAAVIYSEELPPGYYSRQWNASGLSSGMYFYRLHAGSFTSTKRLILLK